MAGRTEVDSEHERGWLSFMSFLILLQWAHATCITGNHAAHGGHPEFYGLVFILVFLKKVGVIEFFYCYYVEGEDEKQGSN